MQQNIVEIYRQSRASRSLDLVKASQQRVIEDLKDNSKNVIH
jgi:hypothetical protein